MTKLISQDEAAALLARYQEKEELEMTMGPNAKRMRLTEENDKTEKDPQFHQNPEEARGISSPSASGFVQSKSAGGSNISAYMFARSRIETGIFSKIPHQLFCTHILKFLSSEDLISCSLVCRFLNYAASDDSLWRRLYCIRWGVLPTGKLIECSWKKLYLQCDEKDIVEVVGNCPLEFKEYYIQMQVAKRSQAALPSQVNDDGIILDKTVAKQVSIWKSSRGLTDKMVAGHNCYGETCTYCQIGDVFVCEKTGRVHVCDENCTEAVTTNENSVCTISGKCFDSLISPPEKVLLTGCFMENGQDIRIEDPPYIYTRKTGVTEDGESFMGSGSDGYY